MRIDPDRPLRLKSPPGPRPWPVPGNLYQVNPVRFPCFADWTQSYSPIVSVWFGSRLNVVVSSFELAREVLKDNDLHLADRHRTRIVAELSRDGKDLVWADYGPHYHYVKARKACSLELFLAKWLDALRPIREDEVNGMVESIFKDCTNTPGKSLLLRKYLGAVALNQTPMAKLTNKDYSEQRVEARPGRALTVAEHIPSLQWMFPLDKAAHAKHESGRSRFTRVIMEEYAKAREEVVSGARQHLVDALLSLKD